MTIQCIFPAELISQILCHTDPRDIVLWRTVSKWFRSLTYDRLLWETLYTDAPFPLPPGPFSSQSNASLERNLIKSTDLAESWTTRPMRDLSCAKIGLRGDPTVPPKLIRGRWLVACELGRRFVLHDSETDAVRVLWEQDTPEFRVSAWDVCSTTSVEGECIVCTLATIKSHARHTSTDWKLLDFRLNESGEVYDSIVIDGPKKNSLRTIAGGRQPAELRCGKSPFLGVPCSPEYLVYDTRTRVFYELPRFRVALDETLQAGKITRRSSRLDSQIAFTDTHIISLNYCHKNSWEPPTVVQVFTVALDEPGSSGKDDTRILRLTHEGVIEAFRAMNIEALKPRVEPITGTTHLRLLDHSNRLPELSVTRIDLTLAKSCAGNRVMPMAATTQFLSLSKDVTSTHGYGNCFQYVDVSNDGYARGFYRVIPRRCIEDSFEYDHMMKFTINTRQDEWVVACGQLGPAEWSHLGETWVDENVMFDGMRGQLCFSDPMDYKSVFVLDIE